MGRCVMVVAGRISIVSAHGAQSNPPLESDSHQHPMAFFSGIELKRGGGAGMKTHSGSKAGLSSGKEPTQRRAVIGPEEQSGE